MRPDLEGRLLFDSVHCSIFDNTKIKNGVPGVFAKTQFDQVVRIAVDYIEANEHSYKAELEFDWWYDEVIEKCG